MIDDIKFKYAILQSIDMFMLYIANNCPIYWKLSSWDELIKDFDMFIRTGVLD